MRWQMKKFKISFTFETNDDWSKVGVKGMVGKILSPIYRLGDVFIGEINVEEIETDKNSKVKEYTIDHCGATFYISECPKCGCRLDSNQVQKYCHECGQRLEWEQ